MSDNKKSNDKEIELYLMYRHLANAHRDLAHGNKDSAEAEFDMAEELGRQAFNAESVHVARFTEDARPYKLALGSILSAGKSFKADTTTRVGDFVRLSLCEVLCRIQKIDPDEMRELYRKWQAEPDLKAGEVHTDER